MSNSDSYTGNVYDTGLADVLKCDNYLRSEKDVRVNAKRDIAKAAKKIIVENDLPCRHAYEHLTDDEVIDVFEEHGLGLSWLVDTYFGTCADHVKANYIGGSSFRHNSETSTACFEKFVASMKTCADRNCEDVAKVHESIDALRNGVFHQAVSGYHGHLMDTVQTCLHSKIADMEHNRCAGFDGETITIRLFNYLEHVFGDYELHFKMKKSIKMSNLFKEFARRHDIRMGRLRFVFHGVFVADDATPESLGMQHLACMYVKENTSYRIPKGIDVGKGRDQKQKAGGEPNHNTTCASTTADDAANNVALPATKRARTEAETAVLSSAGQKDASRPIADHCSTLAIGSHDNDNTTLGNNQNTVANVDNDTKRAATPRAAAASTHACSQSSSSVNVGIPWCDLVASINAFNDLATTMTQQQAMLLPFLQAFTTNDGSTNDMADIAIAGRMNRTKTGHSSKEDAEEAKQNK